MTKVRLDAIGTSTTLESNKSQYRYVERDRARFSGYHGHDGTDGTRTQSRADRRGAGGGESAWPDRRATAHGPGQTRTGAAAVSPLGQDSGGGVSPGRHRSADALQLSCTEEGASACYLLHVSHQHP